jgi:hypothetical protein
MGQDLANRLLGVIDKALGQEGLSGTPLGGHVRRTISRSSPMLRARCATAFQRVYDMILSYGSEPYSENRETLVRYNFFKDPWAAARTPSSAWRTP